MSQTEQILVCMDRNEKEHLYLYTEIWMGDKNMNRGSDLDSK